MRSNFFENIKAIENTLFNSDTFKFILNSGLEKEAIGGVVADIFKQAINGALNLEELEVKAKTENIAYEKSKIDMELAVLNAKAQIKTAQAEAIKSLIQAKAMVRSVVDNAAINRANGYVGLANVIGNASEQKALTAKEMAGERVGGIAAIAAENIEKIDISQINDFDNLLDALIIAAAEKMANMFSNLQTTIYGKEPPKQTQLSQNTDFSELSNEQLNAILQSEV